MGTKTIIILLSLFAVTIDVQSQFYDFFQGYQPFLPIHQTTKRPDLIFYQQDAHQKKSRGETTSNERQTTKEQGRKPHSPDRDSNRQTTKRKHTTTASIFNLNFFTTPKPIKKVNKNSNRRNFDTNIDPQFNENRKSGQNSGLISDFDNNNKYYDESLNNIAGDYYTTTKRSYVTLRPIYATTKRNYATTRPSPTTTRSSYTTTRPSYTTARPSYTTTKPPYATITRPNYATNNFYTANRPNVNHYTTHIPGVKPANVDLSKPPITNKPPALAVYPRPTDSSVIRFPEDPDESPELSMGPDEDKMTYAERRRYFELAEKMCDKYKALNVKKVEAIPLVPSPEPVRLNVSVCPPSKVPLVVGGKVVTIQEFPHMALLGWTKLQGGGYSWKCGGSLISDQYVLTASHCAYQDKDDTVVSGAPRVVQLGSSYLDDTGALVMKVLSVYRHPKYVQTRSYYDVALVKLVKPVTFSEVVKPACLGEPPGVGAPIIATGWGRTEFGGSQSLELRSVSIPVWDMEECRQVLGTSRKLPRGPLRNSQICAGEKQGGKDTCQGDSGGPAQIQDGCAWRVIAVTSVGRSCGAPNTPALYATLHIPFIAAQIFGKVNINNQNSDRNKNRNDNDSVYNNNDRYDTNLNAGTDRNQYSNKPNNRQDNVNINDSDVYIPNINTNDRNQYSNRPSNNRQDNININNDSNVYNSNQNRRTDTNQYSKPNNRQDGINVNDNRNVHFNTNSRPDDEYNLNIHNNRGNVHYNHENNGYYSSQRPDYEHISPNTNLDNESTNKPYNNRPDDVYNYDTQNYNNNARDGNYNNFDKNGYNNNRRRDNNYGVEYYVPSYTVTEAPRYNNQGSWWQPY